MSSDKIKAGASPNNFIEENRDFIYPILFYAAGLILGSFFYNFSKESLKNIFKAVFTPNGDLLSMFLSRSGLYLSIFSIVILLSLCLLGFRLINIVPLICGIALGLKLAYYYSISFKGFLYSLLLISPESSVFITVIIFTTKNCIALSRNIYCSCVKKSDMTLDFNIKLYLKTFLIYALMLILLALLNSFLIYNLSGVIRI